MSNLFVIVNWNNASDTLRCLHLIFKGLADDHSVLLIDNGSVDTGYMDELRQYGTRLQLIQNTENLGFTPACNQGFDFAIAKGYKFVSFINNDAFLDDSFHSQLKEFIHLAKGGIIACKIVRDSDHSILDNLGHIMLNTGEIVPLAHNRNEKEYTQSFQTMGSCAAATVYSVNMIKDIGYYDTYFTTGYEDAEFGVRAILCGYRSLFVPDLKVSHKISVSVKQVDDLEYRIKQQVNIYYSYFKLMPAMVIIVNLPFIILKYLLVILVEFLTLRWKYIYIHFRSVLSLLKERKTILKARKEFMNNRKLISSFRFLVKQKFFLLFDIRRMFDYLFRSKENVFDRSLHKSN